MNRISFFAKKALPIKVLMLLVIFSMTISSCKKDKEDEEEEEEEQLWDISGWFNTEGWNNKQVDSWQELGIDASIFDLGNPQMLPAGNSMLRNAARWDNTPKADAFFEKVDFIGAFGDVDWTAGWADWNPQLTPLPSLPFEDIAEGSITSDVTWTNDKIWRIAGFVRVQDGATLTIEPGTYVVGKQGTKGTLIVQMGGKLIADGTVNEPIVMTSERAPGLREPGDWGGLVVCGKAPNNTGGIAELEGGYGAFHGGNNPDDNSGIIRYVRLEFAGVPINPNEEVNTLTMGSVGRGTTIEYVQASFGLDDSFEWFGGTVDNKYLIAFKGLDDDFDADLGYSGRVQFAIGIRGATLADQSGSNGFEVDNDGAGSANTPFTSGTFANFSIIGPKKTFETPISLQFQHAAQLRRNSEIQIYNSFFTGYPYGLFIDGTGSIAKAEADALQIRNVILAGVANWGTNGYGKDHPNAPRGEALRTRN